MKSECLKEGDGSMSREVFKTQIETLSYQSWNILFDPSTLEAKIVNDNEAELDIDALRLLLGQLEDYLKRRFEQAFGESRKRPLDEFTMKKLNVQDYVLVKDERHGKHRNIFEAYHDDNRIYTMNSFSVSEETGLIYENVQAYLNLHEAVKILPSLMNFVDKYKDIVEDRE